MDTQKNRFYTEALRLFLETRNRRCFTSYSMNKWIRKKIRELEALDAIAKANQ